MNDPEKDLALDDKIAGDHYRDQARLAHARLFVLLSKMANVPYSQAIEELSNAWGVPRPTTVK